MKKIFPIILFCVPFWALSQGFDWQYSPRLPFRIPKLFVGITGTSSVIAYSGNLNLYESFVNCSKFQSGKGFAYSFGIHGEYWFTHSIAFNIGLDYQKFNGNLVTPGDSFPILIRNQILMGKVENTLDMSYSYFNIIVGVKNRLFTTNFFVGATFDFGVKLSTKYSVSEKVISPPEYHFTDGSQARQIFDGRLSDLSFFKISPALNFGYDAILLLGVYASPMVSFEIPLFNYSKEDRLRLMKITAGITIYKGIK